MFYSDLENVIKQINEITKKEEVESTIDLVKDSVSQLREISPLWEMYQDGVDLDKIEWA